MNDIALRIATLSKQYKIGVAKHRRDPLRDQRSYRLKWLMQGNGWLNSRKDTIWALKKRLHPGFSGAKRESWAVRIVEDLKKQGSYE